MAQYDLTTKVLLHAKLHSSELCSLKPGKVSISYKRENYHAKQQRQQAAAMQTNTDARDAISAWLVMRSMSLGYYFLVNEERSFRRAEVHARSFRHTFAKNLIYTRARLKQVTRLLGRSNLNTAQIYITPGEYDLELGVEMLAR